jgi:magnesium chelatase family protein
MSPSELREHAVLDAEGEAFMKMVISHLNVSARVFDRIRKVARTIGDLSGSPVITKAHLAEAVQYREQDF